MEKRAARRSDDGGAGEGRAGQRPDSGRPVGGRGHEGHLAGVPLGLDDLVVVLRHHRPVERLRQVAVQVRDDHFVVVGGRQQVVGVRREADAYREGREG